MRGDRHPIIANILIMIIMVVLVVVVRLFACFRRGYGRFRQHVCQRLHRDQRLEDGEYL